MSLFAGSGQNLGAVRHVGMATPNASGNYGVMHYPAEFSIEAAEGNLPGYSPFEKFGRNPDVDTGTVPEDIWNGGGLYTGFPTGAAETIDVSSANNNDGAGTSAGLLTGRLFGSLAGVAQTEDITLNGTAKVTTTKTWDRMIRFRGLTAGSNGFNLGAITCQHTTTTANIFAVIPVGTNRSQIAAYTVPASCTLYLKTFDPRVIISGGSTGSATVALMIRENGSVWEQVFTTDIPASAPGPIPIDYAIALPSLTDLVVRVLDVSSNNMSATANVSGIVVNHGVAHP